MPIENLNALSPLIVMAAAVILITLVVAIKRNHLLTMILTIGGIAISFYSLLNLNISSPLHVGILFIVDSYANFFIGLILIVSAIVAVMIYPYLDKRRENKEEIYLLIILSSLGGMALAASDHFVSLVLGLETLTISLYVLIGYLRDDKLCIEAAMKYLILAAASTAFLLLGIAFIYAETGSMEFSIIARSLAETGGGEGILFLLVGTGLVLVGAGFKFGVVPFHMWTPDVYQGAPAPVGAFIASVSKSAMMAVLLRYLIFVDTPAGSPILAVIGAIAILSMFIGNIMALVQDNVKRILAYSSIAHLGYALVGLVVLGELGAGAVMLYMVAYSFTIIGAFGIVSYLSDTDDEKSDLEDYRGLFWRRPLAATILSVMLLSLAGIPVTSGFIGKFFLIAAGVDGLKWVLILSVVLTSAIAVYYYLRIVVFMIKEQGEGYVEPSGIKVSWFGKFILLALTAVTIYLGIYPGPVYGLIQEAARSLFL